MQSLTGKPSLKGLLWMAILPALLLDSNKELAEEHRNDIRVVMGDKNQIMFLVKFDMLFFLNLKKKGSTGVYCEIWRYPFEKRNNYYHSEY